MRIKNKKLFFLTIILCGFFGLIKNSQAAEIVVGSVATGDGSGSDWDNVAQWNALSFVRGNTYYLQDGFYETKALDMADSGTTYIYIKKATIDAHGPVMGWNNAMGDGVATFDSTRLLISSSYWDISGVLGGGPGNWKEGHGIVFTSAAGTAIEYIIMTTIVSDINIRHIYFNQVGNTEITTSAAHGIYNSTTVSNSIFEYNYFDNLGGLPFLLREGDGNIIQYNYTGDICGRSIADPDQHCEAIVIHGMDNLHFRWNYVAECPSSGGFVKNDADTSDAVRIYGNVFSHGFPIQCNTGLCSNWRILNNSFVNGATGFNGGDGTKTGALTYNNIHFNTTSFQSPWIIESRDYNWYSRATGGSFNLYEQPNENIINGSPNFADSVTETLDPFVNSTGVLPEDFGLAAPISGWAGFDFCALESCAGERKYNIDAFGNIRGADNVWDRGAIEYVGNDIVAPAAPSGLNVT